MNAIRVMIVEDKSLVADSIQAILSSHGFEVTSVCQSGEDALAAFEQNPADLILMDIELAGALDGIATAQRLISKNRVTIIYLTDYTDQNIFERAKKTYPAAYLAKPFNEGDLVRTLDIAFSNANRLPKREIQDSLSLYFIRTDSQKYEKVDLSQVLYLEADRAYCALVSETGVSKLTTSMNHVLEQIDAPNIVRVHRSYAINLEKVTSIDGNTIKLGSREVQMSKDYRDALLEKLKILR